MNSQTKTIYETGATSHAVNDLILFTDNTRELAEYRDYLYQQAINNDAPDNSIWTYFGGLCVDAKKIYKKEFGNRNSLHIIQMTAAEVEEYCKLYANDFTNWKQEHGIK